MAPASGSHADSDALKRVIRSPPDSAAHKSQLRPSSPTEARRNDLFSAAQQLAQSISSTETLEAAVTEGAQLDEASNLLEPYKTAEHAPVSILEAATKIARDQTAAHSAKLAVLRNSIAKQVATKFLNFWTQSLAELEEAQKPTYSSVVASGRKPQGQLASTAPAPPQRKQQSTIRLPARPPVAPPKEDLRVFVRLAADAPARNHERYAIRTHIAVRVGIDLRRIPAAFPVNTGWAIQTSDAATRDFLVQRQAAWAVDLEAAAVEISQKWHSYVVADCPRRLTDLRGVEIHYEEAVKEEITCQTGLKPISIRPSRHDSGDMPTQTLIVSFLEPTQRPWRLFGASRLARYIDKPSIPSQCDKCRDFHARHSCDRTARCRRCGKTDHRSQECAALEQCANCLGPHCADDPRCPARPKRVHGMVRRLTREERRLTLRIFQANVGKIPAAHDTALALADSERFDIVLLQEPWTGLKDGRCLTKTHPAYDTFSPVTDWDSRDTRPRVMTYVRRSAGLVADQKRPTATRDILWLTVNGVTVVNFYRQPDYDVALEILLRWNATDKCLVSGDFNAKHPSWQAGRQEHRGEDIAFWAMDNQLSLLNAVDVPTNARGNTIDLAFSNIPLADVVVEDHLATGSDHSITLPGQDLALPLCKIRLDSDEELKRLLARAAGRPVRKTTHGTRWWNEECAKAAANYRAWRRVYPLGFDREVQLAKRELQNAVRRAKRLYWRDLIDSFTDSESVFRAVRWLKYPGPFQAPPLQIDGRVYETQLEKTTALRQATLERRTASDDIPDPWVPVNADRLIPFPDQVSFEEARDATLRTGNTSPGSDNITVRMLRAVWHAIGSLVHRLYQGCLTIGHHPRPFREAEVVMIAKLGRRNLSTPRAWRPISLLSCLGKGLERLIARRLQLKPENVDPRAKPTRHSQMFWGAFSYSGRTSLAPMIGDPTSERRGVTGRVVLTTLQEHLPTIVEPGIVFAQDNASTHTAAIVQDWLTEWAQENGVSLVDWPAYSPDLNPIENVWKLLKERIHKNHPELADFPKSNQSKQRLCEAAVEAWEEFEDGVLQNLVESMPRRLEAVRSAKGWYTNLRVEGVDFTPHELTRNFCLLVPAPTVAWASIHFGVLHPQQIGALPKRSAVDLVAALVHDIEEAFARKQVATLVTLDIQGAFDTVLCNRLVLRLREQGWPSNLARWVGSFMQDRSARIRYQDIVTDSSPLQCGLPQGSPVSPILFLLYTEPIYRLGNSKGRFGYADDTAILCVGDSLDETLAEASHHVRELLSWGAANGISFDPDKTEVMHFLERSPRRPRLCYTAKLRNGARHLARQHSLFQDTRREMDGQGASRRLPSEGTDEHQAWSSAECYATGRLRLRSPRATVRGGGLVPWSDVPALDEALQGRAVGDRQPRQEDEQGTLHVSSGYPTCVENDTDERAAQRGRNTASLSAPRSASDGLCCALESARRSSSAHQTHVATKSSRHDREYTYQTEVPKTAAALPDQTAAYRRNDIELPKTYSIAARKFRDWLQALPPRTLVVYSDGSRSEEGHVGYGYAVHRDGSSVLSGKGRLGPAEVFDAEARGALEGLKAALSLPGSDCIFVCLKMLTRHAERLLTRRLP
ncbi:hypothetical protein HIM_10667 [Hirsutella minnesotensis 3608]|uniref:Reverse transcriptase n=1 Tax=Hirsutella minnesotensis 3608 TaxID=1043627 RepID=A0A0F8A212_9HYPO|nr:hypothetical protein HIM_10667 [Hirsutella minnesotensis 3608]